MKEQKIQTPPLLTMLFLTWFYTGKFPKAPGTVGSFATLPFIYLLHYVGINIYSLIALIVTLILLASYVTEKVQKEFYLHDPQWIVIDEVIGMLITWSFVMTLDFPTLFLVFTSFRFFDIVKPWPVSYFDRLKHGSGTILDDAFAGVYAGIFTFLMVKFI